MRMIKYLKKGERKLLDNKMCFSADVHTDIFDAQLQLNMILAKGFKLYSNSTFEAFSGVRTHRCVRP